MTQLQTKLTAAIDWIELKGTDLAYWIAIETK
jgi:hypothetical protein